MTRQAIVRGFVYFIQAGTNGPIKIGWADDVNVRLKDLQVGNHEPLTVLAAIPGVQSMEYELHKKHARFRIRGEWFKPEAEVLADAIAGRPDMKAIAIDQIAATTSIPRAKAKRMVERCESFPHLITAGMGLNQLILRLTEWFALHVPKYEKGRVVPQLAELGYCPCPETPRQAANALERSRDVWDPRGTARFPVRG